MPKRTTALLIALALTAALLIASRTKRGGEVVAAMTDAIATLGDWTRKIPAALRGVFASAGAQYGLPAGLLEAVAYRESRFRADIISGATRSSAGAVGIMQIIPRWHPEVGEAGALDPKRAIPYAAKYLRQLRDQFGSWTLALAAYNWGPGNLSKARDDRSKWPAETRTYVDEITRNAGLA